MDEEGPSLVAQARQATLVEAVATSAGMAGLAGALSGFFWGGIGGRIAMRILVLTSDDRVRGVTSDDGFEIGAITGETVVLLIFATVVGTIVGAVYGFLRMITTGPTWLVAAGVATAAATAGGASIVHTNGVDFGLLEPLWLAVGLFILIPALWGLTLVVATERLLQPGVLMSDVPDLVHRRYWRLTGWVIILALVATGLRDLARDISALN